MDTQHDNTPRPCPSCGAVAVLRPYTPDDVPRCIKCCEKNPEVARQKVLAEMAAKGQRVG